MRLELKHRLKERQIIQYRLKIHKKTKRLIKMIYWIREMFTMQMA